MERGRGIGRRFDCPTTLLILAVHQYLQKSGFRQPFLGVEIPSGEKIHLPSIGTEVVGRSPFAGCEYRHQVLFGMLLHVFLLRAIERLPALIIRREPLQQLRLLFVVPFLLGELQDRGDILGRPRRLHPKIESRMVHRH